MIKIITSIVIYNPNLDDLNILFSSYAVAMNELKDKFDVMDEVHLIDNNPEGSYRHKVEALCDRSSINFTYNVSEINGGYGYGHNQSIKQSDGQFHLVCNPDIEFKKDTFLEAVKYMMEYDDVSLLSPSVFGKDGKRQYLCKRNPSLFKFFLRRFSTVWINRLFFKNYLDQYEFRDKSYDDIIENVPHCTGCFMFFNTKILKKLKGFDERFFMYMEDADISRRALQYGKTVYFPKVQVIHRWERGAYKDPKLRNEAIKSAFQYSVKWCSHVFK